MDKIETEVLQAQEPVVWFAFADSNGPVPLELWGFDQKACKHAVLENARSVGWKGTVEGYLLRMAWTIRPLAFIAPQPTAPASDQPLRYATDLAIYLAKKFYPDVTQWRPLDDLVGVLTQIDNMVAGVAVERDALQAKVAEQNAEIEHLLLLASQSNQDHMNARRDYQQTLAEQAVLIEKCEGVLQAMVDRPKSHEAARTAVQTLAAIVAQKSGAA